AVPPSLIRHTRFICDISKRAVAVVTIERGARRLHLSAQRIERRTVDQVDIEPAVVVIINKGAARARRFNEVILGRRAGDEAKAAEACGLRHVDEAHARRGVGGRLGNLRSQRRGFLLGCCGRWGGGGGPGPPKTEDPRLKKTAGVVKKKPPFVPPRAVCNWEWGNVARVFYSRTFPSLTTSQTGR